MSTIEVTVVECDEHGCEARITLPPGYEEQHPRLWYIRSTLDLCPTHVRERVERPAPPAAPTAGTTTPEGITFALLPLEAVWVAAALERDVRQVSVLDPRYAHMRQLIRDLNAQIEDVARAEP